MMRPLRKRHLQVWIALAIILPSAIAVARLATPASSMQSTLQPAAIKAFPEIIKKVERENYEVRIRKDVDGNLQLEWINKKALTVPTATIYQTGKGDTGIQKGKLIGRIESRGNYYFPLSSDSISQGQFIIYDFIHEQVIDTITF